MQHSAQLRRGGQRDDRRRRLLADECLGAGARSAAVSGSADASPERRSENYGDAAFLHQQRRVLDLVPQRLTLIVLLTLAALAVVAAFEALYLWMLRSDLPAGRLAAFDLGARGNLSGWFSSLVLLATSLAALGVYAIRRHKADDYRGRYRVWLWAALGWFLLSADVAARLHADLQQAMVNWTGTRIFGDGAIWWIAFYLLLFGALGSRLLIEIRHCRLSSLALLATAACYAAAGALRLGWIPVDVASRHLMFQSGSAMLGHVLLLLASLLYARYVLLDAEGLLPRRPPRAKRAAIADSPEEDGRSPSKSLQSQSAAAGTRLKIDSPQPIPQPAFARSAAAPVPVTAPAATSSGIAAARPAATFSSNPAAADHKLSKAERKALRQRLEAERLKRQSQQQGGWK